MAEQPEATETDAPPKSGKKGLLIGLVLALLGGAGSFFAVYSNLIFSDGGAAEQADVTPETQPLPKIVFVPLEPLVVSVGTGGTRQLRFRAELEVDPERSEDVVSLMPRIMDALNGYLRAVDIEVLQDPTSLIKIRAHMLRRVAIVTGRDHVRDLLITEFVFI